MAEPNPYESPKTVPGESPGTSIDEQHVRWLPFDIGRSVGRYLQVLGCLSVASSAVNILVFQNLSIDFSFIFLFWGGACLIRHSPRARKWVIAISGLFVLACFAFVLYALLAGTQGMGVMIGGRWIPNPPIAYVVGVAAIGVVIPGIPFVLLLTRQAKDEFTQNADAQ